MTFHRFIVYLTGTLAFLAPTWAWAGEPEMKPKFVLKGHSGYIRTLAFSPDGKLLVSSSNDLDIRLWDVVEGKAIRILGRETTSPGCGLAFHPNGKMVASSTPHWLRLWPIAEGEKSVVVFKPRPTGKYIASGSNLPLPLDGNGPIFSPDGKYLASYPLQGAKPKPDPGAKPKPKKKLDDYLLVKKEAHLWKLYAFWDVESGELVPLADPPWIRAGYSKYTRKNLADMKIDIPERQNYAFTPDSSLLAFAGGVGFGIDVWDVSARKIITSIPSDIFYVELAFSPDGSKLAVGTQDNIIRVWDVAAFKRKKD